VPVAGANRGPAAARKRTSADPVLVMSIGGLLKQRITLEGRRQPSYLGSGRRRPSQGDMVSIIGIGA